MITQSINLNLIPGAVPPRIKISQYDQGSRTLTFTLYNGTTAFTTSGVTAKIQGTKPDMKGFAYDASYSSGVVTANLTRQMSCVAGDVLCELVLYKNGEVLGTGNFVLDVEASALADDVDTSETVLPAYIDAAERAAADAATSAVNAAASATSASGSASSASASANSANTAKTAAETAQAAAETASTTAVSAKNTAVDAKDTAVNAKTAAETASTTAVSAKNTAVDAKDTAVNAKTAAETAQAAAETAQAAAESASTTAVSAKDTAVNAKTAAETAQTAAEAAAAVATAAELNPPYIGANGNWYVYDTVLEAYKDSGIDASITTNIADITMLEPDAAPYVTNTGTSTDTNFHFYIPRGLKGDTGNTGAKGDTGDTGAKGDKGDKGETGTGIASIEKTGTSGLVDTYTITYTDGTTQEYTVTNGASATLPAGGTTGQALVKLSSADSDAGWRDVDIPAATAQTAGKVKPDGTTTTVDANGTISAAQTPVATAQTAGKVKPDGTTTTVDVNGTISAVQTPIATANTPGKVKPDGETITIDNDGTIHGADTVPVAAVGRLGKVKPDGTSIIIDADGTIHAKGGGGVPVGDVSGAAVSTVNETATFTWSDPADVIIDGTTIAAWAGTKLVRKLGSAPADEDDGTVILDNTVRNAYATTGFTDSNIEYDTTYYYRFFPYTDRDVVTKGTGISVTPERTIIPLPSQDGAVIYNGSQQTAQFADYDSNKMEVTGNTGTNAGSYTAQFTPKHDYMWSDGTTTSKAVSWIISKKPLSVPSVSGSYTYDTTQKSAVIGAYDVNEITQSGDSTGTNAGTYNVLFDLVDSSNMEWSDGTTGQKSGSWVIAKAAGGCTLSKNTVTLDMSTLTDIVTISNATGNVTGVSSSDTSVATASLSGFEVTISNVNENSGTATITIDIAASQNYAATTATISVECSFITDLESATWAQISRISQAGTASSYWSVGDTKKIRLNGTVGTLTLSNYDTYVYIIGFDHNSSLEGSGISFGGFKTAAANGTNVALCDASYNSYKTDGTKIFNMNHWGNYNYGGWKGCDARYDILGSVDTAPSGYGSSPQTNRTGNDAGATTATSPVANTLMAALPSDLRAVMKPVTKYTDNKGNYSDVAENVTSSVDYLPLLSEYEVQGARSYANQYEKNSQAQYAYYANGNSKIKYNHSSSGSAVYWWCRSASYSGSYYFCLVGTDGGASYGAARYSIGLAPAFLI